jgi:hypothetical protein
MGNHVTVDNCHNRTVTWITLHSHGHFAALTARCTAGDTSIGLQSHDRTNKHQQHLPSLLHTSGLGHLKVSPKQSAAVEGHCSSCARRCRML